MTDKYLNCKKNDCYFHYTKLTFLGANVVKKPPNVLKMPVPATLTARKPEDASISECHTHLKFILN